MLDVYIGRKTLATFVAHHWAVKVGSKWYEVEGAGKRGSGKPNNIVVSHGRSSKGGAQQVCWVGETDKDFEDISIFNDRWLDKHPKYNYMLDNCQQYAHDLVTFCCGSSVTWPKEMRIQSCSMTTSSSNLNSYNVNDNGTLKIGFSTYESKCNIGPEGSCISGPKASIESNYSGSYGDFELCRAEKSFGPVNAAFAPNLNTGAITRNGNFEASILGTGIGIGKDGIKAKTPLGEVGCSVM